MSRRVLAEASGMSARYIAQLESGTGNVTILLLRRVARAAGITLEDLVGDTSTDMALIRDLLRTAPPAAIERVKAALSGASEGRTLMAIDRVALIGLRGAGKSTLGRMAAERLGWDFIELNREVENEGGLSMPEMFRLYGQEGYRRLELKALRRINTRRGPLILAVGGGIVSERVTFELLLSSFFTVWVKASPEEHMARVRQQGDLRPMANDDAAMDELRTILSNREPLYARARAVVDTTGRRFEEALKDVLSVIGPSLANASSRYSEHTGIRKRGLSA